MLLLGRSTGELRGHELEVDDADSVKDNVSYVTSLAAELVHRNVKPKSKSATHSIPSDLPNDFTQHAAKMRTLPLPLPVLVLKMPGPWGPLGCLCASVPHPHLHELGELR